MDMPTDNQTPKRTDFLADDRSVELDPELMLAQLLADPHRIQHWVRTHRDGVDSIATYNRCDFVLGQQRYVWHLSFLPPFSFIPEIEARAAEDVDLRVRVTDRQKFGARLEIVLPQPAVANLSVLIEATATASSQPNPNSLLRFCSTVHE